MAALNPALRGLPAVRGRPEQNRERARRYHDQVDETLDMVRGFVDAIRAAATQSTSRMVAAFWAGDQRAQITVRTLGRMLGRDLAADLHAVAETLDDAAPCALLEFSERVSPHLFSVIDAIAPSDVTGADGRDAAEQYHQAVALRNALVQRALTVVNERYGVARFQDLQEASQWVDAFASVLEDASEVIAGTQQLLRDEAMAVQSFLDQQRKSLEKLEREARAARILIRELDWREQLARVEREAINLLAERADSIERVAFERIIAGKSPGAVEKLAVHAGRRVPRLGMLLLGLLTAATGVAGFRISDRTAGSPPTTPAPARGSASGDDTARHLGLARQTTAFGVLPRQYLQQSAPQALDSLAGTGAPGRQAQAGGRAGDAVRGFFAGLQQGRGRQELVIKDGRTLESVLTELERFGYPKSDVLSLLNLDDAASLGEPLSLGVRVSQGGQLLLFPPQRAVEPRAVQPVIQPAYTVQNGDTLSAIAGTFGVSLDKLVQANPQLSNPDLIEIGQTLLIPGPSWTDAQRQQPLVRWGDRLDRIGELLGVPPETLARLNNIARPDQWIYDGRPLVLPADGLSAMQLPNGAQTKAGGSEEQTEPAPAVALVAESTGPEVAAPAPVEVALAAHAGGRAEANGAVAGEAASEEAFEMYTVQAGDSLVSLATTFDTTVRQLIDDNGLDGDQLSPGQDLLIRRSGVNRGSILNATAGGRAEALSADSSSSRQPQQPSDTAPRVRSTGGIGTDSPIHALEQSEGSTLQSPAPDRAALVARYGDQTWDSLEAMPPEVRAYFERTIEDVAAFFNVRAGDVAGILRAEQNDKGWTLHESGVSSAGATGVAQVVARTWNGWSNPEYDSHSRSLADIERYGGLGFDWAAREQWRAWKQGRVPLSALEDTNADPTLFENGVAAIARHLVHWDLTRDVYAQDAAAFDARLGDAIAVYNSGRPLSESRNFTQSSANRKTVGDYVAEVKATAQAWEGREAAPTGARLAATAGGRAENRSVPSVQLTATPASNGTAAAAVVEAVTGGTGGGDIPVIDAIAEGQTQPLVAIAGATEPLALALGNGSNGGGSGPVSVELRAAVPQAPIANARFRSYPLLPMPKVFKPFGTAVNYQAGGRHTGIDVAGPHGATLYAVADGVVTYVGPLYCDQANACRGQQAIVLDLGDNTYAVYSHNSASFVRAGDRVVAGQAIGQQGNEGYSFGSHLHFEVHVGAPFSGDWHQPFRGGEFVDPMQFFAEA